MVKESAKAKRKYVVSLVKMFREDLEAAFFSRYFRTRPSSQGLRKEWISTMQRTTFPSPTRNPCFIFASRVTRSAKRFPREFYVCSFRAQ